MGTKKQQASRGAEKVEPPKKNNRVEANEQALLHFKGKWDVFWNMKHYQITAE